MAPQRFTTQTFLVGTCVRTISQVAQTIDAP